jgi:hypothetical protein
MESITIIIIIIIIITIPPTDPSLMCREVVGSAGSVEITRAAGPSA